MGDDFKCNLINMAVCELRLDVSFTMLETRICTCGGGYTYYIAVNDKRNARYVWAVISL